MVRYLISNFPTFHLVVGQERGPNYVEVSEDGTVLRPTVTNEEAIEPDYIQQSLLPMASETHSGAGKLPSLALHAMPISFCAG